MKGYSRNIVLQQTLEENIIEVLISKPVNCQTKRQEYLTGMILGETNPFLICKLD